VSTTPPLRNDILIDKNDGERCRVVHINTETDQVWLISLCPEDSTASPFELRYSKLTTLYTTAPAGSDEGPERQTRLVVFKPTDTELEHARRAMACIEPLLDDPGIFEPSTRNQLLKRRSAELKAAYEAQLKLWIPGTPLPKRITATAKTLLKDLRAFWRGGMSEAALYGNYRRCGHHEVVGTGKRGRPRGDGTTPYQLHAEDYVRMRRVIEEFYFKKDEVRTIKDALQELHEMQYTYKDGNGTVCLRPKSECPSYRQLYTFLHDQYPLEVRLRRRKGDKEFERDHRAILGSVQFDCHGVGHVYEFDATVFDVLLVSSKNRAAIVGKPTVYLIIDRWSRLIVGWYVGFENASYVAAVHAILSIGEDKEALCKRLGIPYDEADWPAHLILPESFLADQGELVSKQARRIARGMRTMLSNVPGLRPDWKPLVECGFKMLPQIIAPHTPGYSPDSDNRRRRAPIHDKDACLTLSEFTTIIVAAIIAHNRTPQEGYPLQVRQVGDEVLPIPRDLYRHGMHRRMGRLDRMNFERVMAEITPRSTATISEHGIRFANFDQKHGSEVFYRCAQGESQGWFIEGRRSRKPVEIAFDYRLPDTILVFPPGGSGEPVTAQLTGESVMFKGMPLADITRHFYDEKQLLKAGSEIKRNERFGFNSLVKPIAESARRLMKEQTEGKSRASRTSTTAESREEEKNLQRTEGAATSPWIDTAKVGTPMPPAPNTAPTRELTPAALVIPIDRKNSPAPSPPASAPNSPISAPMTLKERMAISRKNLFD